jgi:hypothetical protein
MKSRKFEFYEDEKSQGFYTLCRPSSYSKNLLITYTTNLPYHYITWGGGFKHNKVDTYFTLSRLIINTLKT